MDAIGAKIEKWISGRLGGLQAEIEEIEGFLNKYAEDPAVKKTDKVARYRMMLACRLHTKQELETMHNDLSSLFEIE